MREDKLQSLYYVDQNIKSRVARNEVITVSRASRLPQLQVKIQPWGPISPPLQKPQGLDKSEGSIDPALWQYNSMSSGQNVKWPDNGS